MQAQQDTNKPDEQTTSTLEELKHLAPLAEEWLLSLRRQYAAGKDVVGAEWSLTKRSLGMSLLLGLLLCAVLSTTFVLVNVAIGVGLYTLGVHLALVFLALFCLDVVAVMICWKVLKRVCQQITMNRALQLFMQSSKEIGLEDEND
ncbi:hypothetical protein [Aliiglaciecola sp. LCG003]|uniref:hypothetical protein n=1 Tax=Aliiglaciecola sp. LCG003 TaxID=3053655 RepID=UPI00257230D9|nr:hypothetical protein [Aliiglaciecola sp. LCG003]WJG09240.1 hypothetical protein QR722_18215 [Aliiglaciecola sp. LCG003]